MRNSFLIEYRDRKGGGKRMKYCINCGSQLSDQDKFCTKCGAPQGVQQNVAAVEQEVQQNPATTGEQEVQQNPAAVAQKMQQNVAAAEQETQQQNVAGVEQEVQQNPATTGGQETQQQNVAGVEQEVQQNPATTGGQETQQQQQSYAQPDQSYIYQQPATTAKFPAKAAILLVGIVVVALGVIYLVFQLVTGGSGSVEKAVKEYYEAICDKDGDTLLDATCTDSMIKALEETSGYEKDDIADAMEEAVSYSYEDYGKVKDIKVEEQDKMTKAELREGLEGIKEETGVDVNISEMRQVEVTYKYYDTYYKEWNEDTEYLTVYKSGSKWYVFPDSF